MSLAPSPAPPRRSYHRLGDERLAALAGRGDTAAATAIHGRYADALLGYCRSIVHDPDDAQDVFQQTMLNALRALERRELRAPLRPWLFRIAHNTSISLLRRRRPADELHEESLAAGHGVDPETELLARERLRELVDDVAALPERQRTALLLYDVAGLPHAAVAAELGCSDGASRQTVTTARAALREAAAGRDVPCAEVRHMVDAGDRRRLRARPIQAHLRTCAGCGLRAIRGRIGPPTRHVARPKAASTSAATAPAQALPAAVAARATTADPRSTSGIASVGGRDVTTAVGAPRAGEEVVKNRGQPPDVSFGPRPVGAWNETGQSPTVGSVADRGRHWPAGVRHRSSGSRAWRRPPSSP